MTPSIATNKKKKYKGGVDVLKTLLRLTASYGTSWIDAQQDATPKGKKVSFMLRPLYPRGKEPPLPTRMGPSTGLCGMKK
jgi:hypothetical protein